MATLIWTDPLVFVFVINTHPRNAYSRMQFRIMNILNDLEDMQKFGGVRNVGTWRKLFDKKLHENDISFFST